MTHIFLSYSREDVDKAKQLAQALEQSGLAVWWDRTISPGETFDKVIESALADSSWVIVLWSVSSIESNWVKAEAEEALRRDNLIPILIEDVRPPLAFRRLEAAELQNWDGDPEDHEFHQLLAVLGGAPPPPKPAGHHSPPKPGKAAHQTAPAVSTGLKLAIGSGLLLIVLLLVVVIVNLNNGGQIVAPPETRSPSVVDKPAIGRQSRPVEVPPPEAPRTGTINLQYLGDNFACALDLSIDVGDQRVVPQSNLVVLDGVPLGNVPYSIVGTIGCPNAGNCAASGNGTLYVNDGGTYNLMWQNTSFGQCQVTFIPAG